MESSAVSAPSRTEIVKILDEADDMTIAAHDSVLDRTKDFGHTDLVNV